MFTLLYPLERLSSLYSHQFNNIIELKQFNLPVERVAAFLSQTYFVSHKNGDKLFKSRHCCLSINRPIRAPRSESQKKVTVNYFTKSSLRKVSKVFQFFFLPFVDLIFFWKIKKKHNFTNDCIAIIVCKKKTIPFSIELKT